MNWLDPAEVEAWLGRYNDNEHTGIPDGVMIEALERFVRAVAAIDFNTLKYPERGASMLVDMNDVARLLRDAMEGPKCKLTAREKAELAEQRENDFVEALATLWRTKEGK